MSFESSGPTNQDSSCIHEDEPVYWGQTTDPSQHNPDNFRYLVHAFNPFSLFNAIYISKKTGASNDEVRRQSIDLRIRPEEIDERVSVSMSLIENGHTATYGSSGIIVQAPESSIVFTSPTDAGVINSNKGRLVARGQSRGLLSPDQLLEHGSPHTYNEVVALGRSGLRAVGLFYKVDSRKKPVDSDQAANMLGLGRRTGLPVVEIPKENIYTENKVVRYTYMDSSRGEELRIFLGGMHFPSPEKFEAAIGFALRTGEIGEDEANQILEDYRTADIERQTPTAYFDEDGEIDRVECLQGYGEREVKLNINRHGIANKIQKGAARLRGKDVKSLSQYATDRMIEAAVKNLSPEKAESIRSWYEKVRPSIADTWSQQDRARSRMGYRIIR